VVWARATLAEKVAMARIRQGERRMETSRNY
jgi:hypothetical protein